MIGVIGKVMADIAGNPCGQIIHGAENPGTLSMEAGGIGWNLCRSLASLGEPTALFAVAGQDLPGRTIKRELEQVGVEVEHLVLREGEDTPMSLEIRNIVDDLEMSFSNEDALRHMDGAFVQAALGRLAFMDEVVTDASLSVEGLEILLSHCFGRPLFLDPTGLSGETVAGNTEGSPGGSSEEREKKAFLREKIGTFHTIVPNRREAEALTGLEILSREQVFSAGEFFADKGVRRIFITLSGGGVYYREGGVEGIVEPEPLDGRRRKGVGDAFTAGVVVAFRRGMDVEQAAGYAARVAGQHWKGKEGGPEGDAEKGEVKGKRKE